MVFSLIYAINTLMVFMFSDMWLLKGYWISQENEFSWSQTWKYSAEPDTTLESNSIYSADLILAGVLFLAFWLWIFIVDIKGFSSQWEQNRGSRSKWGPMSFKEAVVNVFSEMEKFKYKLTMLAVGREYIDYIWKGSWLKTRISIVIPKSATVIFQKLIQASCGTER